MPRLGRSFIEDTGHRALRQALGTTCAATQWTFCDRELLRDQLQRCRSMRHAGILLVISLIGSACTSDAPLSSPITGAAKDATVGRRKGIGISDEEKLRVSDLAPAFAGFYADSGSYVAMVTDLTQGDRVRSALASVYGSKFVAKTASRPWRTLLARNSYQLLAAVRDSLFRHVLTKAVGGTSIGIDEINNVVTVGVSDDAAASNVATWIRQLAIPILDVRIVRESAPT